jgi:predicted dinucleotide-binding enzyme
MKIAIIGAGRVGKTLESALEPKGHSIAYGTRDPAKAKLRHKALNTTGVGVMARPRLPAGDAIMFVAGPAGADKKIVLRIVAESARDFAVVMARRDAANRNAWPRVRMVDPHPQEAE